MDWPTAPKSISRRRPPRQWWYLGVWLLILLLTIVSCSGGKPETAGTGEVEASTGRVQAIVTRIIEQISFATTTPDPTAIAAKTQPRIVLDLSLTGTLPNLDPGTAERQAQLDLAQNLFVGLTNYNQDTNTIEPELATSWSVSPDGRTWTFSLRDDIYWVRPKSPGPGSDDLWPASSVRPVTADDVVFAIQRLCSRQVESPLAFSVFIIDGCEKVFSTLEPSEEDLNNIGIKAVNPTTLEILLTEPSGFFLTLTSLPFFQPVPRDLVTESGNEWLDAIGEYSSGWQTPDNLVTSGPYMLITSQLTSENATLHRNPLWPIENAGNVDEIKINFLSDEMDAFESWKSRTLDLAPLPLSEREAILQRSPAKVLTIPGQVLFYIGFNFGSGVFKEPEVRRAFSAAIDRQVLLDELYEGRGIIMRHATVPGVVAALPVGELGVGYSPDFARQQMADSSIRSCRLLPEVTMLVSSADLSLRQAEIIRDMWIKELGCLKESIKIEQVQFGELLARTKQDSLSRPDMWELAWAPTYPDSQNLMTDLLHCQDSENRQNRDCSEADTLMQRAGSIVDPAERATLYRQAESIFFNENGSFPIAPLYIRSQEIVVQDWVTFNPVAFGGQQWNRIVLDANLKELEQNR